METIKMIIEYRKTLRRCVKNANQQGGLNIPVYHEWVFPYRALLVAVLIGVLQFLGSLCK